MSFSFEASRGFLYFQKSEVLSDYCAGIDIYAVTENAQKDIEARGRNVRETVGVRGEAASEEAGEETRASREEGLVTNWDEVFDYSGMTDQEAGAQANEVVFSRETDPKTLDFLNNQQTVTVYRAMQVMWGRLYPPMAAKVRGEDGKRHWVEPTEYGQWYRSDEHPELVDENGKFLLDKGDGTSLKAAYNPYFHTSNSPLNDQFTSAYRRKNLVIVECSIPKSELTSGYRAEGAKDTVGEMNWHSGPVSSKLKGDKARRVTLSRWVRVERIVPEAEAAQKITELLDGTGLEIPANTVTPALREELEKQGVKIGATRGTVKASRELSSDEVRNAPASFGITKLNDYIHVQQQVYKTLVNEGFFGENNRRVVTNQDSGKIIEIGKRGIEETFGKGDRYQNLPRVLKDLKLAAVRFLPEMIESGEITDADVSYWHKPKSSLTYSYIKSDLTVDGITYPVYIDIRQSPQKNVFWVHSIRTNESQRLGARSENADNNAVKEPLTSEKDDTTSPEKVKPQNEVKSSREADAAYLAAVKAGEEWKAERMVRDAALAWGAATNEEGKPLDLDHGTPGFGFAAFDISDRQTAAAGTVCTTRRVFSADYAGRIRCRQAQHFRS